MSVDRSVQNNRLLGGFFFAQATGMNTPPFTEAERVVFHELMTEIRHVRDSVGKVHDALDNHVTEEDKQYSELREDNKALRTEVAELKGHVGKLETKWGTRWGMLASVAGIIGAAVATALQKVFFS